jgi:hypothetical protein
MVESFEVIDMGRWVYAEVGNIAWEWKFAFATQCSNFGFILELMCPDYVERIDKSESGERVIVDAPKKDFVECLKVKLLELKLGMLEACPVCNEKKCLDCTVEMFEDFLKAAEKCSDDEIYAEFFVEY